MASGPDLLSRDKGRLQRKGVPLKRPRETFATRDSFHGNKKSLLNATTHWRKSKDKQSPTHTGTTSAHRSVLKEMWQKRKKRQNYILWEISPADDMSLGFLSKEDGC